MGKYLTKSQIIAILERIPGFKIGSWRNLCYNAGITPVKDAVIMQYINGTRKSIIKVDGYPEDAIERLKKVIPKKN